MEKRRYILTPAWSFRGWKLLPYAVQSLFFPRTEFFGTEDWQLFSACDGQRDINWAELTEAQRKKYEHWEKNGFIRTASGVPEDWGYEEPTVADKWFR